MSRAADLRIMTIAAEKAAVGITRDFGELERLQVSKKGFKDFVTSSDRRAENQIQYFLSKGRPDFSMICEESGEIINQNSEMSWIIDPIDGTANFMRGIPYFSINIALQEKENSVAGLTLDPMRGECFKTETGGGAFINRQRLRVSGRESPKEAVFATHISAAEDFKLSELGAIMRRTGSVALDLAYLSAGKYDAVIAKDVSIWDIAVGLLMVKESGGFLEYSKSPTGKYEIIAASSMQMLSAILSFLK